MNRTLVERIAGGLILAVAALLLAVGLVHTHKVYDMDTQDYGVRKYTSVSEFGLVTDATFSGTIRKGGALYSTYDRTQPRGKRSCPT